MKRIVWGSDSSWIYETRLKAAQKARQVRSKYKQKTKIEKRSDGRYQVFVRR